MTLKQQTGSRAYLFSIVLVAIIGGLLFGYDTAVVSGAEQALDQFFRSAADFTYTSWMHGFTASSALIGCVIGGAISGLLASRFGRKRSLVMAAVLFFVSAVGSWWPESGILPYGEASLPLLVSFNIYRVIGGIGVGLASAVCPMYIAEISPAKIRGTLVSCNQFAIIFGMLVVYFVNYLIRNHLGDTGEAIQAAMVQIGWRRMFLSEAFPAGAFFLLIMLVPETPRFLALKGNDTKAFSVLERINGTAEARSILDDIKATVHEKREKLFAYGTAVIVIGVLLSFFQQAIGITFIFVTHDQEEALSMSDTVVVMDKGEIQQIGSPIDIYNEPKNAFVADFIGESNILDGTMIEDYLVEVAGQRFKSLDSGFGKMAPVDVVIRPEDIDIVPTGSAAAHINGVVTSVTFKGVHYEIIVDVDGFKWMIQTTDSANVGDKIGLALTPDDIHVMAKSVYSGTMGDYSTFSDEMEEALQEEGSEHED